MIRRLSIALILCALFAPAVAAANRVGVLPFQSGSELGPLAGRLQASLAERLEGPLLSEPKASAQERSPEARDVRSWVEGLGLDALVVGRVAATPSGVLALDVSLRSGHSGAELAADRIEAATRAGLESELPALADRLLREVAPAEALPHVSAALAAPAAPAGEDEPDDSFRLSKDDPISIESDELEVIQKSGARQLIFTRNVRVIQGDLLLKTRRLEALYVQGASQPRRLVATGDVEVLRGDRSATCDRAVYEREADTVVCTGHAVLMQGCDRVRGREIEFDLGRDGLRVSGAASVLVLPERQDGTCEEEPS